MDTVSTHPGDEARHDAHHGHEIGSPLSQLQRDVLDIARDLQTIPDGTGRREQYVTTRLGMSYTAYMTHLVRLLDSHAAEREYPVLIHRLRRIVADRNTKRGH